MSFLSEVFSGGNPINEALNQLGTLMMPGAPKSLQRKVLDPVGLSSRGRPGGPGNNLGNNQGAVVGAPPDNPLSTLMTPTDLPEPFGDAQLQAKRQAAADAQKRRGRDYTFLNYNPLG